MTIQEMKKIVINKALDRCKTKKEAAKVLGISVNTLYAFLEEQKGEAENLKE